MFNQHISFRGIDVSLREKLAVWQKDLLDMSRMNNLLYYRSSGRGAGIQLPVSNISALFAHLVNSPKRSDFSWLDSLPEKNDVEKQLLRLRARAREDINDRGIQTLYVAFGFLEWKESEQSDDIVRSPLVLVPVTLVREGVYGRFAVERVTDEDIEINPALREKLLHDFRLQLPTYADIIGETSEVTETVRAAQVASHSDNAKRSKRVVRLEDVFGGIEASLQSMNWRIAPEAHLGRFSFQKLVMYHDLREHAEDVLAHDLVRVIGGERRPLPPPRDAITAGELDRKLRPHDILEVLDADSSQQEAIRAAKAGASFVLQGPPGTGKSQTIANIIAECLSDDRRILFVSEKMAALDVVRQRLQSAGLGEYCLDLHSVKTDKKVFIDELASSLTITDLGAVEAARRQWQQRSDALLKYREELNHYVRELHEPRFALQQSAYHAYGKLAKLSNVPFLEFTLDKVTDIDQSQFDEMRHALEELLRYIPILEQGDDYPWHDTIVDAYSLELESRIRGHFGILIQCLDDWAPVVAELAAIEGIETGQVTFREAREIIDLADCALSSPLPPLQHWLTVDKAQQLLAVVADMRTRSRAYHDRSNDLSLRFRTSLITLDHAELLRSLTDDIAPVLNLAPTQSPNLAHDFYISHHREVDEHLRASTEILAEVMTTSQALADACFQPAPTTVEGVNRLLRTATCIAASPNPPSAWLDPGKFSSVRIAVIDAAERYTASTRLRAELESIYAPEFFDLDINGCAQRFRENYQSPLRFLKPRYYQDVKQIRTTLQAPLQRNAREIATDLARAEKLIREEAYLKDHRLEHAEALGRYFDLASTDWAKVRELLVWTQDFHACFAPDGASADVIRLVTSPGEPLRAVKVRLEALLHLWERWDQEVRWLWQTLVWHPHVDDSRGSPQLADMHTSLMFMHMRLRTYWNAVDRIREHSISASDTSTVEPSWETLCHGLHLASQLADADTWAKDRADEFSEEFGARFDGYNTDWESLDAGLTWCQALGMRFSGGIVPSSLVERIALDQDAAKQHAFAELFAEARHLEEIVCAELKFTDSVLPRTSLARRFSTFDTATLPSVRDRASYLLDQLDCLERWLVCKEHLTKCRDLGLDSLIEAALSSRPFPRDIAAIFEQRFFTLWLDTVRKASPVLGKFQGETHERVIERFRELDVEHAKLASNRLQFHLNARRARLLATATANDDSLIAQALAALLKEVRHRRHRSIRHIVRQVAPALLELKPCWMMSPQSVSQFVGTAEQLFDVVIFDEASQVCPEDAIGAILRGRQLIVVGDSKQLPPTRFFAKSLADSDDDDADDGETHPESERTESILDQCLAVGFAERSLRWHYRSRHESLIAFSNHHFYEERLITFPSPAAHHAAGVQFIFVPDGVYDRSHTRTNQREAERVADLVFQHMRERAGETLGVVTLSEAQQSAIRDEIATRLKKDPSLSVWQRELLEDNPSGFFVKNLESVQGDERDVMILSIGYGPDASHRVYTNFGPVNRQGGERRLNVAVTRAKIKLLLVTSMRASHLPETVTNPGVRSLRAYLDYAENGPSVLGTQSITTSSVMGEPRFDSPFEEAVYTALTARGLRLDTQIGCSGYRIDMAVRDLAARGTYLIGIECDGRTYHSSATARDRDRLRQRQLESMGWTIHRIWSSDWRQNSSRQVELVLQKVEAIRTSRLEASHTRVKTVSAPIQQEFAPARDQHRPTLAQDDGRPHTVRSTRLTQSEPRRSAAPAQQSRRSCETCQHFSQLSSNRFLCRIDGTVKKQHANGHTIACGVWQPNMHGVS